MFYTCITYLIITADALPVNIFIKLKQKIFRKFFKLSCLKAVDTVTKLFDKALFL